MALGAVSRRYSLSFLLFRIPRVAFLGQRVSWHRNYSGSQLPQVHECSVAGARWCIFCLFELSVRGCCGQGCVGAVCVGVLCGGVCGAAAGEG